MKKQKIINLLIFINVLLIITTFVTILFEIPAKTNLNSNNYFTMDDASLVLEYIKGNVSLNEEQISIYDINKDGILDVTDVVLIINIVKGEI